MIYDLRNNNDREFFTYNFSNKRIGSCLYGVTSGCFDLFHIHHLIYLERCSIHLGIGKFLIVGVDSDNLIKKTKGSERPIISDYDRAMIVDKCKYVDSVFIMDNVYDHEFIVDICDPIYVFKNEHVKQKDVWCKNAEFVVIPDIIGGTSTTEIINNIKNLKE